MFLTCPIGIVCIDETKIVPSFPDAQFPDAQCVLMNIIFHLSVEIEIKRAEGKLFLQDGIIAKKMKELEGKTSEIICMELTFSKKKRLVVF